MKVIQLLPTGKRSFSRLLKAAAIVLFSQILLFGGGVNLSAQVKDVYVTIDKEASIREILDLVESQSDVTFVFADEVKQALTSVVTVKEKNISVNKLLEEILPEAGLLFSANGKQVLIYQPSAGNRNVAQ